MPFRTLWREFATSCPARGAAVVTPGRASCPTTSGADQCPCCLQNASGAALQGTAAGISSLGGLSAEVGVRSLARGSRGQRWRPTEPSLSRQPLMQSRSRWHRIVGVPFCDGENNPAPDIPCQKRRPTFQPSAGCRAALLHICALLEGIQGCSCVGGPVLEPSWWSIRPGKKKGRTELLPEGSIDRRCIALHRMRQ